MMTYADNLVVLPKLDAASFKLCLTSPVWWKSEPYGGSIGCEETQDAANAALVATFRAVKRVLTTDGVLVAHMRDTALIVPMLADGWFLESKTCFARPSEGMLLKFVQSPTVTSTIEAILPRENYGMAMFTPMPVELVKSLVSALTSPGDKVLDPFAGTGTTVAVAEHLGRTATGIELLGFPMLAEERAAYVSRRMA